MLTERYRLTFNRIRPHSSLGYRLPAPETIIPGDPVPMLESLTWRVVQPLGAGQTRGSIGSGGHAACFRQFWALTDNAFSQPHLTSH